MAKQPIPLKNVLNYILFQVISLIFSILIFTELGIIMSIAISCIPLIYAAYLMFISRIAFLHINLGGRDFQYKTNISQLPKIQKMIATLHSIGDKLDFEDPEISLGELLTS